MDKLERKIGLLESRSAMLMYYIDTSSVDSLRLADVYARVNYINGQLKGIQWMLKELR